MRRNSLKTALAVTASAATLALVAQPDSASAQTVSDQTLSDVEVSQVGDCTTLTINFNIRVQILSYFPSQPGKELHIRLRPLNGADATSLREAVRTPSSVPSLTAITYEGDNASGPVLSLLFNQDTRFEVEGGSTPDKVVVRLYHNASSTVCAPAVGDTTNVAAGDEPGAGDIQAIPPGLYVVNAISNPGPIGALSEQQQRAVAGKVVYDSLAERGGVEWHRLRVGFFETKAEAEAYADQIEGYFPAAWAIGVTAAEREQGIASRIKTAAPAATVPAPPTAGAIPAPPPPAIAASAEQSAQVDQLIADAETAIQEGNNDRAIALLTNARALPEATNTARAIELLGLTRERKGQLAQARGEYEDYLARYGQTEGASRVAQRLAALSGPPSAAPTLREASGGGSTRDWTWGVRGSFSQFYFRDQTRSKLIETTQPDPDPEIDNRVNLNQLLTAGDITITGGNDRSQIQMRAAGSYALDFQEGEENIERITALYLGFADSGLGLEGRIGRQTRNSGGVFGRFDGSWIGFSPIDKLRINAVGGRPVLTSSQTFVLKDRRFYGMSLDIGAKRDPFQATIYALEQRAPADLVDRRSIGAEARYVKGRFNSFGLIDYDIKYNEVNLALATLNFSFPDTSSISLTGDYRKSPLLTIFTALSTQTNAITQQPITNFEYLLRFYTPEQLYDLASVRTQTVKTLTGTYARPINEKLQVNFDLTLTSTSGTPLIPATPGTVEIIGVNATGTEIYTGAQLIGTGLIWDNDTYIASARYSDASNSRSYAFDLNARVPLTEKIRLSPRIRYAQRSNKADAGLYRQLQPSMRVNFYPFRHGEIELEAGVNFALDRTVISTGGVSDRKETGLILTAGYRIDF